MYGWKSQPGFISFDRKQGGGAAAWTCTLCGTVNLKADFDVVCKKCKAPQQMGEEMEVAPHTIVTQTPYEADAAPKASFAPGSEGIMQPDGAMLFKTRLCTNFQASGQCPFAEKCHFAHGEEELNVRPNLNKTSICKAQLRSQSQTLSTVLDNKLRKKITLNPLSYTHRTRAGN